MDNRFVATKEALANATLLHHPVQGALTALTTNFLSDSEIDSNHWSLVIPQGSYQILGGPV